MDKHMKYSVLAITALVMALGIPVSASAQTSLGAGLHLAQSRMPEAEPEAEMRMPVPGGGGNLAVKGCWRSKQVLFDRYRGAFCRERGADGSYRVDGGGLSCRGDLDWSRDGRRVEIRFNRGRCNRNTDWSRDRISCSVDNGRAEAPGIPMVEQAQARMPIPSGGEALRMNCVYRPSTGSFGPERFTARRTD